MRRFVVAISTLCAVAVVGQISAGTAVAAAQSRSAVDTVAELEAAGHHVQLNGSASVPLSQCTVTGIHGLNNSNIDSSGNRVDESLYTTVYVDVSCQTAN